MSIKEFVDEVLCVPVTRIGNRYIVEAIELVIDTKDHKFYPRLAEILNTNTRYLEKAIRDAKNISLTTMDDELKKKIFNKLSDITTSEYIVKSAEYYKKRRNS